MAEPLSNQVFTTKTATFVQEGESWSVTDTRLPGWTAVAEDQPECAALLREALVAFPLMAQVAAMQAERDAARAERDRSHENRTKESLNYATLCAEIVDACDVDPRRGWTARDACAEVRNRAVAAQAESARLREACTRSMGADVLKCALCGHTNIAWDGGVRRRVTDIAHADDCALAAPTSTAALRAFGEDVAALALKRAVDAWKETGQPIQFYEDCAYLVVNAVLGPESESGEGAR